MVRSDGCWQTLRSQLSDFTRASSAQYTVYAVGGKHGGRLAFTFASVAALVVVLTTHICIVQGCARVGDCYSLSHCIWNVSLAYPTLAANAICTDPQSLRSPFCCIDVYRKSDWLPREQGGSLYIFLLKLNTMNSANVVMDYLSY